MNFISSLTRETKWGLPANFKLLGNPGFITMYDYGIMQPRYVLYEVSKEEMAVQPERNDCFRPDVRLPLEFRQDLSHYAGTGYDRGHMAPSAACRTQRENMSSFLMSNMCPQTPECNRGPWKDLEDEVRELAKRDGVLSVHCCCGPVFRDEVPIECLRSTGKRPLAIPHSFFMSWLVESVRGAIKVHSRLVNNDQGPEVERIDYDDLTLCTGLQIWNNIEGSSI